MIPDCKIQAKWVMPMDGPAIENGVVEIADGQILAVHKLGTPSSDLTDLGEVTLIPGLVNAHTHLEFSNLRQPLGNRGMNFVDWIALVIGSRKNADPNDKVKAIKAGLAESATHGVVAIGEIATEPLFENSYQSDLHVTTFFERLGIRREQSNSAVDTCEQFLACNESHSFEKAISPHAPYSVHPVLLDRLVELSCEHKLPIAMHLAETKDEILMLDKQQGKFVGLLESLGLWSDDIYPLGTQIMDLLKKLARCPNSLIIHGNYLTDADISFIASKRDSMSVVYCPRTHDYFEHAPYPLEKFLAAGINVAIGTDSRASNPDLNLFDELKLIKRKFPQLDTNSILKMGTASGAQALRIEKQFGMIRAGLSGMLSVIATSNPNELLAEDSQCVSLQAFLNS